MKETEVQFFRPLWRRLLLLSSALLWSLTEFMVGSHPWLLGSLALTAYIIWRYLLCFPADESRK